MSNKLQPNFFFAIGKVIPDSFGHYNVSSLHSVLFRLKCKTTCRLHVGERCAVILNQVSVIGQCNSRSIVKILALFFSFLVHILFTTPRVLCEKRIYNDFEVNLYVTG